MTPSQGASPRERALGFTLPGVMQGLAFFFLMEVEGMIAMPLYAALAMAAGAGPSIYFLSASDGARRRAVAFSLAVAVLVGALVYVTQLMTRGTEEIDPMRLGVSAILLLPLTMILVPLYRAVSCGGRPGHLFGEGYFRLFDPAWKLPVTLVLAGLFVGVFWSVLALLGGLFNLIGIGLLYDLYAKSWFSLPVTFGALATAISVVRDREGVVLALRTVLFSLLKLIAPIFAVATLVFSAALLAQGLDLEFLDGLSPVAILGTTMALGILLVNALLGEEGRLGGQVMTLSAYGIIATLVIFAVLCGYGLGVRIGAEGLTPPRLYAAAIVFVLIAYAGVYGTAAVMGGRWGVLRAGNVAIALGMVGLLLLVQSPLFAVYSWSAKDQEARALTEGDISSDDVAYFAFSLGEPGREALRRLSAEESLAPEGSDVAWDIDRALTTSDRSVFFLERRSAESAASLTEAALEEGVLTLVNGDDINPNEVASLFQNTTVYGHFSRRDLAMEDGVGVVLAFPAPGEPVGWIVANDGFRSEVAAIAEREGAWQYVFRLPTYSRDDAAALVKAARRGEIETVAVSYLVPRIGGELIDPVAPDAAELLRAGE